MTQDTFTRADLAAELVTLGDVALAAGVPVDTVDKWRRRHEAAPKPVATTAGGVIYLRSEWVAWLVSTGRLTL